MTTSNSSLNNCLVPDKWHVAKITYDTSFYDSQLWHEYDNIPEIPWAQISQHLLPASDFLLLLSAKKRERHLCSLRRALSIFFLRWDPLGPLPLTPLPFYIERTDYCMTATVAKEEPSIYWSPEKCEGHSYAVHVTGPAISVGGGRL